jgi:nitrogen fixation-related uncharacterized protein
MSASAWILVIIALAIGVVVIFTLLWRSARQQAADDLPTEWPLVQRPLFSPEERALYRQLRAALPHHMILAKVPLVRFCQPVDRNDVRYWFGLLGPIHVSFIICADNGRVLAALDIRRPDFKPSRRTSVIKQSVLAACRIRYVECRSDQPPSTADLQNIVPQQGETAPRTYVPGTSSAGTAAQAPAGSAQAGRSTLAHAMRTRRGGVPAWYESGYSQDSFFAPDMRNDNFQETDPNAGLHANSSRFPNFAAGHSADLQSHRQWPPRQAPNQAARPAAAPQQPDDNPAPPQFLGRR